tara:strand:+ start:99 stop:266 length:168 start_codon:yes stop_codon:yes gene_type:complete
MALRKECPYCEIKTVAKRLVAYYVGSELEVKVWECRECFGIWSGKTMIEGLEVSL